MCIVNIAMLLQPLLLPYYRMVKKRWGGGGSNRSGAATKAFQYCIVNFSFQLAFFSLNANLHVLE